jgi:hypothetical protein
MARKAASPDQRIMDERVAQLEVRLDALDGQLSTIDDTLGQLRTDLEQSPEARGWRSLEEDIAQVRWRAVTVPMIVRTVIVTIAALAVIATAAYVAVRYYPAVG